MDGGDGVVSVYVLVFVSNYGRNTKIDEQGSVLLDKCVRVAILRYSPDEWLHSMLLQSRFSGYFPCASRLV